MALEASSDQGTAPSGAGMRAIGDYMPARTIAFCASSVKNQS
jgi:hypothetical protein